MGKERGPPQKKLYRELNVEREKAKKLLLERTTRVNASEEEIFEDTRRFMIRFGSLSANVGKNKDISNYKLNK